MVRISSGVPPADWDELHKAAADTCSNHSLDIIEATEASSLEQLDLVDKVGMTALHVAAQSGNLVSITVLLAKGANANACDDDQWNAIHHATYNGHRQAVRFLIESGTNVNKQAVGGSTPLHFAAFRNDDETAKALIKAGALKTFTDDYGRTASDIARSRGLFELAKLLAP